MASSPPPPLTPSLLSRSTSLDKAPHTPQTPQTPQTPTFATASSLSEETEASKEFDVFTMARVYRGNTLDSDQEASDDENEPLSKAGAWTMEEAAHLCRRKMIRLQGLHIEQFKRLRHVLQLRYDQYRRDLEKAKREPLSGPVLARAMSPTFRAESRALRRYRKRKGDEALLRSSLNDRRVAGVYGEEAAEKGAQRRSQAVNHNSKCQATIDVNVTCMRTSMPFSSYCFQHICTDSKQLLYSPCARYPCLEPVAKSSLDPHCLLHATLATPETMCNDIIKARDLNREVIEERKEREKEKIDEDPMDGISAIADDGDVTSFKKYLNLDSTAAKLLKSSSDDGSMDGKEKSERQEEEEVEEEVEEEEDDQEGRGSGAKGKSGELSYSHVLSLASVKSEEEEEEEEEVEEEEEGESEEHMQLAKLNVEDDAEDDDVEEEKKEDDDKEDSTAIE